MIGRVWGIIQSWFGWRRQQPLPIIKKLEKKERFLVIDDPYQARQSKISKKEEQPARTPMPKDAEQLQNTYMLIQNLQPPNESQIESLENNKFFLDMREMDKILKQIEQKQTKILENSAELMEDIDNMLYKIGVNAQCEKEERELYRKYVKTIQDVLAVKYVGQRVDYPDIGYKKFKEIWGIWELSEKNGQNTVPGYDHLRFCHLRLLGPGRWLNDEVISQYINLMNGKLSQRQGNSYVIFNSLKVTSLFDKADYKKLQKVLERQKVTRNTTLILAIHKVNHWLFLKMQNSLISIYDSMLSNSLNSYTNFQLIKKIIKFSEYYYGNFPQIEKIPNFPQQSNGHDCGMMMLLGMKDLVRDYRGWSFSQNDVMYKRVLVTKELMEKQITGF